MTLMAKPRIGFLSLFLALCLAGCGEPRPMPLPERPPVAPKVAFESLIASDPDAIRCNVTGKAGEAMTITTPRLVPLYRFKRPATIRCFAQGYWTEQVTVLPGSKQPLLIRALEGEIITPANASVRGKLLGRGGDFPREVKVTLRRDVFESASERDAYYAKQLTRITEDWANLLERAKAECAAGAVSQAGGSAVSKPTACRDGLRRLTDLRNAELRRVEQQRRRSRIP